MSNDVMFGFMVLVGIIVFAFVVKHVLGKTQSVTV